MENNKQITLNGIFSDPKRRELFIKESRLLILKLNERNRLEHNEMMYKIFTPTYIQILDRIKGRKPYRELKYRPII